jgi:DNA-binding transcriptional MocR family regulator
VPPAAEARDALADGHDKLRLSFSAPTPERIEAGVARLAITLRAELAARETAGASGGQGAP